MNSVICYAERNKQYKNLLLKKKEDYNNSMVNQLISVKDSVSFWKIINAFRYRWNNVNIINLNTWHDYFNSVFDPIFESISPNWEKIFRDKMNNPFLDSPITKNEVVLSLQRCKNNKADDITLKFLKSLLENSLDCLTLLYNKIWDLGKVPDS